MNHLNLMKHHDGVFFNPIQDDGEGGGGKKALVTSTNIRFSHAIFLTFSFSSVATLV